MQLSGLVPLIEALPGVRRLSKDLDQGSLAALRGAALGVPEAARAAVVAALVRHWQGPVLWVTAGPERARLAHDELGLWTGEPRRVQHFPAPEALFYDRTPWEPETVRQRVAVLAQLAGALEEEAAPIIVAPAWALMVRTVPAALLKGGIRALKVGQFRPPAELAAAWLRFGYQPVSVVEEPGSFSMRGGIVDVYPPNLPQPVRLEFFGDEIDSLRAFDPATQRSGQALDAVQVVPASEAFMSQGPRAASALRQGGWRDLVPAHGQRLERDVERLERGEAFLGMEYYLPYLYPQPATLLDYVDGQALVIADDLLAIKAEAQALEGQAADLRAELQRERELPVTWPVPYLAWGELAERLAAKGALSLAYDAAPEELLLAEEESFQPGLRYGGRMKQALDDVRRVLEAGGRAVLVSRQTARLRELLAELNLSVYPREAIIAVPPAGSLTMVQGSLSEGWALAGERLAVLTDAELYGWRRSQPRRQRRARALAPEAFFADLREGEYVVHMDHGVGIYRGLVRKTAGDTEREYLEVEYQGGDRLFVPAQQVDRLTRYVGGEAHEVTLQRLGTADWAQIKARTRRAVEDIARDLLELYATREVVPGHAFASDNQWQLELEESFPYDETRDQLQALSEVKGDMEKPKPMDRLICGDVGYGKTEVALRAAFKAVMDGRQVAVLVPTTVLAQQHYYTFEERLRAFPVKVEMLSRFRTHQEQKGILEELEAGTIDIIIGTHRLIQRDVKFGNLGLLIVDEEQRFGVGHKERLKRLRREVDVLTLSATPIPRTLYMALTGVRDMSTINTPPEDRLPIRTQVVEYDEGLVRKAILRELDRGGQVFFVHNRVQGIYQMTQQLQRLVPEASFCVGHGQMDEGELARVMLDFAAGRYDVLVCTTIIESGLDIPNVNTIIINRADRFGLAQLYQLRGRVGRSANRAYAYLLYNRHQQLTPVAGRRLEALLEAAELGAGFQIAMRDLEIRGAGEMLGPEQHGHIVAVGFDLYCRMLAQAIKRLKAAVDSGQAAEPAALTAAEGGVVVDLPLSAHLPESYVADTALRLRLYRRLAEVGQPEEVEALQQELAERFGPLPAAVQNLLYLLRLKVLATRAGVAAVATEGHDVVLRFPDLLPPAVIQQAHRFGSRVAVGRNRLAIAREERWRELLVALLIVLAQRVGAEAVAA
ncbi:MAG TPA: transcription-repair coupling factor [Anaerolineae bacterium]|nr:transcription-repair coupling factor [Anaerolineae bacterium]